MRAVLVLPLVPVMWMEGYARCGSPSTSIRAAIRVTEGSSLVSPQRPASSCSTACSALSVSGSAGRVGMVSPWGGPDRVRRVRLPASITARSGSRWVASSTISAKVSSDSDASCRSEGRGSLTGPVYGWARTTRAAPGDGGGHDGRISRPALARTSAGPPPAGLTDHGSPERRES
ncbi:hypothetical protein ACVWXU_006455 [Streptomyces sp. TE33382]